MDRSGRVAVVIPALNEAASIGSVVAQVREFGMPIVVDDGSSDGSGAIALAAGADVVCHPHNLGYDGALNSGFARALRLGCDSVVTVDADGQHNPALLQQFIAQLAKGADVVIGVRDRRQRLAEHVFAWVAQWLWSIDDPLCGMKAYRLEVYRTRGHFDAYGSIGTELAIYAARAGRKIVQVPIRTRDRAGASRFGRRLRANWRIFRSMVLAFFRTK